MNDGFLGFDGLRFVGDEVNSRIKFVETMPPNPAQKQVVMYVGEDNIDYKKSHIYQAGGYSYICYKLELAQIDPKYEGHYYYIYLGSNNKLYLNTNDTINWETPAQSVDDLYCLPDDSSVVFEYKSHTDTVLILYNNASQTDYTCNVVSENNLISTNWVDITPKAASEISISVELTHNVPRLEPIDITKYLIDGSLWDRIAGTNGQSLMNDIYIGDYLNLCDPNVPNHLSAGINGGTGYVTIAGIDTLQGNYTNQKYHHLVMVPGKGLDLSEPQHFGGAPMNSESTTNGGYAGSKMATETLKIASAADSTINGQLYQVFGSHLKTTKELVSNSINTTGYNRFGTNSGCSNSFAWIDCQCVLMSEMEVYGSIVWSSSGFDTGNANKQLPLFAFSKIARNNGTAYYWLKDIASASAFCHSDNVGNSNYYYARNGARVRPRFVIA